jgi:hypothetical protein
LLEQAEPHVGQVAPRLGEVGRGGAARGLHQAQLGQLQAVGLGVQAEAVGDRQAGLAQGRLVRGLGPEAIGIDRLGIV